MSNSKKCVVNANGVSHPVKKWLFNDGGVTRVAKKVLLNANGKSIQIFPNELPKAFLATGDEVNRAIKSCKNWNKIIVDSQPLNGGVGDKFVISSFSSSINVFLQSDGQTLHIFPEKEAEIFANENSDNIFYELDNLYELDIEKLNTRNVTRINQFLWLSHNIEKISWSTFDTTNMRQMDNFIRGDMPLKTEFTLRYPANDFVCDWAFKEGFRVSGKLITVNYAKGCRVNAEKIVQTGFYSNSPNAAKLGREVE